MRRNHLPFALLAAAAILPAQSTLTVGPGGFATVQLAIDAASPGDEVVIEPGIYPAFSTSKGLTIRAQIPGTVEIESGFLSLIHAPPSQPVQLVGLLMRSYFFNGTTVSAESCVFESAGIVLSIVNSNARFENCQVIGQTFLLGVQGSLVATNSTVTMVDSGVAGAPGAGSPGVVLVGSHLIASHVTLQGSYGSIPREALNVDANSSARISDSSVVTANNTCGVVGTDVVFSRSTLPASCSVPTDTLLGVQANGAIVRSLGYEVTFRGEPNQFVLVFGSDAVDLDLPAVLQGPFLLGSAGCFPAGALVTDAQGQATLSLAVPLVTLPPGLAVYLQGVSGSSFPLLTSAVVGGVVR
ncbi:MAG: hypothetical protein KAI24_04815 [Planctomycetes bacterium]|nr:hypothetical protein [Planctomycetota bacterium]